MSSVLRNNPHLAEAVQAIERHFGKDVVARASTVDMASTRRIPTGVFELDRAIGGGLPKGLITLICGDESGGKTTLCLKAAGNIQHMCRQCLSPFSWHTPMEFTDDGEVIEGEPEVTQDCECGANEPHVVVYVDTEGTIDLAWAATLGVDVPQLFVTQPENAEQTADTINALIRSGEADMIIFDSIAQATPNREIENSAAAGQRPDLALLMNKLMRTMVASVKSLGMNNPRKPVIIMTNQNRVDIGKSFGDPTTITGGSGQKYAASIRIDLSAGKLIDAKGNEVWSIKRGDPAPLGKIFHFHNAKNKTAVPHQKGSFGLFVRDDFKQGVRKGDFDNFIRMVDAAEGLGVIDKGGAWYDLQGTFGEDWANPDAKTGKFQGKEKVIAFIEESPERTAAFKAAILEALGDA